MRARRNLWMLVLAVAVTGACKDMSGPETEPDVSGTWQGTLSHPAYDGGALTLTLIDANGQVSGNYRLILSKRVGSRASVEQSGGELTGSAANGRVHLRLKRTGGDEWLLDGEVNGGRVQGEWSNGVGVRGTFGVSR